MKKLMLIALLALGATAFAADETTLGATVIEATDIPSVTVSTTAPIMTLSESFMAAFGMGDTTIASGSSTEGGATTSTPASSAATIGAVSAAANAATTIANNSTTIVTPYGKY